MTLGSALPSCTYFGSTLHPEPPQRVIQGARFLNLKHSISGSGLFQVKRSAYGRCVDGDPSTRLPARSLCFFKTTARKCFKSKRNALAGCYAQKEQNRLLLSSMVNWRSYPAIRASFWHSFVDFGFCWRGTETAEFLESETPSSPLQDPKALF